MIRTWLQKRKETVYAIPIAKCTSEATGQEKEASKIYFVNFLFLKYNVGFHVRNVFNKVDKLSQKTNAEDTRRM